jgi:hypothetical protein
MMGFKVDASYPYELISHRRNAFELVERPGAEWTFTDLNLYMMGLGDAAEVSPSFLVMKADVSEADMAIGRQFHGEFRPVDIADILEAEGPRVPDPRLGQRDFSVAFVLVTRGDLPTGDEVRDIATQAKEFRDYWRLLTRGRSRIHVWA